MPRVLDAITLDDRQLETDPGPDDGARSAQGELEGVLTVVDDDEDARDRLQELQEHGGAS